MPFSNASWDAGRARRNNTPEAYCRLCLFDLNAPGATKIKDKCKCPLRYTPGGPYVKAAIRAAAGALAGARDGVQGVSAAKRRSGARTLVRLMREAGMTPGASIRRIAGRG